jgi:O-antigen/teichoic acid export membrane protein
MAILIIVISAFNIIQTLSFNTEYYKIEMDYIIWGIFSFSCVVICYGLYLLFKKKKAVIENE